MNTDIPYLIALLQIPGVGPAYAQKLMTRFKTAKAVFEQLPHLPPYQTKGIPLPIVAHISSGPDWEKVNREMDRVEKNGVHIISRWDKTYPQKLNECSDAPPLLYTRGEMNLNSAKILGVVGTRRPSRQGLQLTKKIIEHMASHNVLIASGLAFGIDICAHKSAMEFGLPTVAVVGHGLGHIYPAEHRKTAFLMERNGGLISELPMNHKPEKENFPKRNRIIAGISDAVLVIESKAQGGSIITADLAHGYGREVLAVPGKPSDVTSAGCNRLIKTHQGAMVESGEDILEIMNWGASDNRPVVQRKLFVELNDPEKDLLHQFDDGSTRSFDGLIRATQFSSTSLASTLLSLELKGVIKSLPGRKYHRI